MKSGVILRYNVQNAAIWNLKDKLKVQRPHLAKPAAAMYCTICV